MTLRPCLCLSYLPPIVAVVSTLIRPLSISLKHTILYVRRLTASIALAAVLNETTTVFASSGSWILPGVIILAAPRWVLIRMSLTQGPRGFANQWRAVPYACNSLSNSLPGSLSRLSPAARLYEGLHCLG